MILFKSITCGISSLCFGFFYNCPKKVALGNFILGAIGVFVHYILVEYFKVDFLALAGSAFVVGLGSEIFARIYKHPATVCLIPGLIPLVPGLALFKTMQGFAMGDMALATEKAGVAIISATAIALGIVMSSMFSKSINRTRTFGRKFIR